MSDLKYEDLWFPIPEFEAASLATEELRPIAAAFYTNVTRVHFMIEYPSHLLNIYRRYVRAGCKIQYELSWYNADGVTDELANEWQRRIVSDEMGKESEDEEKLFEGRTQSFSEFLTIIQRFDILQDQVRSNMVTILLSTWTALEVLLLQVLQMSAESYGRLLAAPADLPAEIRFQRLEIIREAYDDQFKDPDIHRAIGDRVVTGLSMVRHLFTHKNGVVDAKFKREANAEQFYKWAALPEQSHFLVNGSMVREYAEGAFRKGMEFVQSVDRFISSRI